MIGAPATANPLRDLGPGGKTAVSVIAALVLAIGLIGFVASFVKVAQAAEPFFGVGLAWMVPVGIDVGILAWLASHEIGFKVSEKTIIAAAPDGRDAVRGGIRELETYGYLVRERERLGGKFSTVDYILCDPFSAQSSPTNRRNALSVLDTDPPVSSLRENHRRTNQAVLTPRWMGTTSQRRSTLPADQRGHDLCAGLKVQ
ncbi:hypothetical protein ABZ260_46430 [Streptosporangium sp. NPDC006013]|uniref:hypothetical protein n=1 Tax=Streptosporangium sp. NPDC006013 TaxID=3155596 RepID=UPI0033A31F0F